MEKGIKQHPKYGVEKDMEKVKVPKALHYMASNNEPFSLNINVELDDHRFNKKTEEIIDGLMEGFYKKFMEKQKDVS